MMNLKKIADTSFKKDVKYFLHYIYYAMTFDYVAVSTFNTRI